MVFHNGYENAVEAWNTRALSPDAVVIPVEDFKMVTNLLENSRYGKRADIGIMMVHAEPFEQALTILSQYGEQK